MFVALFLANAFSALPSAFYARITAASGNGWSTALLFSGHGAATIAAMSLLALPRWRARLTLRPAAFAGMGLALDLGGGVVLAATPASALWALVLGRLLCGFALGIVMVAVSWSLAQQPGGATAITAAVFGGVGTGALMAACASAVGLSWSATIATGALVIGAAALSLRRSSVTAVTAAAPRAVVAPSERHGGRTRSSWIPLCGAFAANGVLALFTSTVPADVARLNGGAGAIAGLTAATAMLAAGAARVVLVPWIGSRWVAPVGIAVGAGAGLLILGFTFGGSEGVAVALAGGALLGAGAGLGYDASLRTAAGAGGLSAVQRAGQAGLVLPTVIMSALVR